MYNETLEISFTIVERLVVSTFPNIAPGAIKQRFLVLEVV
jgi:hypothetical protein